MTHDASQRARELVRDVFIAEGRSFLLKDEDLLVYGLTEAITAALQEREREVFEKVAGEAMRLKFAYEPPPDAVEAYETIRQWCHEQQAKEVGG